MFIVYDENMNLKELPQGVRPLEVFIPSIQKRRTSDFIENRDGYIPRGSTKIRPPIQANFGLESQDIKDYSLLRDELFAHFSVHEYLYVSESKQRGKRYKVTVADSFIPEKLNKYIAKTLITFEMYELPYAESIGTTQIIQQNGVHADDELWGYGMGLLADDDSLVYTHQVTGGQQFAIYNAGNVAIHPFQQDLNIKIRNLVGSSSFLQLKNDTTGSTFKINEAVANQTIELDGPNITSNGLQILRKTNKQYIQLAPGWNYFTLTGATSAEVSFDFRFYYE